MAETAQPARPLELFYSYAHKDEALREELVTARLPHDIWIFAGSWQRTPLDDELQVADACAIAMVQEEMIRLTPLRALKNDIAVGNHGVAGEDG